MRIHEEVLQRSPEWYALRCGIPTASEFSSLLTPKTLKPAKSNYAHRLAFEEITGLPSDEWSGNEHTERGIEAEQGAIEAYQLITDNVCKSVGFVTNEDTETGEVATAGCSPDQLVNDDGLLEIKAPLGPKIVEIFVDWMENGPSSDFKMQLQGQMMICKRKWCDLILFHQPYKFDGSTAELAAKHLLEPKIIRVEPDYEIWDKLQVQIDAVIQRRDEIVEIWRNK